mmetsp:Transcript_22474/g.38793  ORF Transcript_22474/g.38793 Transcript_22474/m.38793 type:complete len:207 (+) Transcript_22474:114-734(+)|eukprot:CAMPEP_0184699660 /NCGR_PEP_ID=MMETSP0313-20130426/5851_1 /TAXON_ID=2792 /ORGANISM="Porphyridium aerugineum, Strain SAG 1380-2" /LENGTH=206 /DNA_ID=CAMNT_0027158779 /DNA_START=147 /DNA_END=770 /DNA_ORIENTATION=-
MPAYELTYFNLPGRAEPIRLAFIIGNIPFKDNRIEFADWGALKPNTTFGSLPIIKIDGKDYTQSCAILTYVGKQANLYPSDPLTALKVDEILHALVDFNMISIAAGFNAPNEEQKKIMQEDLVATSIPKFIGGVEKLLAKHNGKFAVGDQITVADLLVLAVSGFLTSGMMPYVPTDVVAKYPHWNRIVQGVKDYPAVKKYYESQKA